MTGSHGLCISSWYHFLVFAPDRTSFCFHVQALRNTHISGFRCSLPRRRILSWKVGCVACVFCTIEFILSNMNSLLQFNAVWLVLLWLLLGFILYYGGKPKTLKMAEWELYVTRKWEMSSFWRKTAMKTHKGLSSF